VLCAEVVRQGVPDHGAVHNGRKTVAVVVARDRIRSGDQKSEEVNCRGFADLYQ